MKLYAAGLHQLDGVRFGRRWHGLLLLLATRTYNTALLALDAIHYGYPIQSIILSRSIYENVLTAGYVRRYPRQARFWLAKKYMADKASESIPRFGAMRAKEDKDTREKLKQMYGVMSQFAHPRPRGIWAEHELRGEVSHLRLGPRADEGQTIAAHYVLLSLLPHALRVVALFIAQHDAAWWQAVQALTIETAEWLTAENQNARAAK